MNFRTLGLGSELVDALSDLGFQTPTPIQEKAIPTLLLGEKDFVGLAQTGTGKTGAFGLPLIQRIDPARRGTRAIVICPTRELCLQITDDLKQFAKNAGGVRIVAVYGGASIGNQIRQLRIGAGIIVATPGRLLDLERRRAVDLSRVSCAVLDEADEMLNMGFQEDIDAILGSISEGARIWLFSATMPRGVAAIARKYLDDPVEVTVGGRNQSPKNIEHVCHVIPEKHRFEALKRVIDYTPGMYGLVFCRTRKETGAVAEELTRNGHRAEALHGDLSQAQRDQVMRTFRTGTVRILVATDVAARGLDVEDITHVIHYRLPDEADVYTHRGGRTGRAGKSGVSLALISPRERSRIRTLEKRGNIRFAFHKLPDGRAICEKRITGLVDKIVAADVNRKEIDDYLPAVYEALGQFDKEELIKRLAAAEFNRLFDYYRHAGDIDAKPRPRKTASRKPVSGSRKRTWQNAVKPTADRFVKSAAKRASKRKKHFKVKNTHRFFINVGRLDKINEGAIVRLLCDKSGIRSHMIGQIDLKREFSFFEVEKSVAERVRHFTHNAKLDGRQILIRPVVKKEASDPARRVGV